MKPNVNTTDLDLPLTQAAMDGCALEDVLPYAQKIVATIGQRGLTSAAARKNAEIDRALAECVVCLLSLIRTGEYPAAGTMQEGDALVRWRYRGHKLRELTITRGLPADA